MFAVASFLFGLLALTAPPPAGAQGGAQTGRQAPPVTFKVEVNYVEVDAGVFDKQGNFVRDLRREDFEVFEDGRPQKVTAFSLVDIPVERPETPLFSGRPIEPDVATSAQALEGRIYLLVLDDLHTSAQRSARVRAAVRQFIERRIGVNDLAAVVTTGGGADTKQEFTNNRRLLLEAVDRFVGRKLRSPTLEKIEQYYRQQGLPDMTITDPTEAERAHRARGVFDDLRRMSEYLAGVRGRRKALVFVSEGVDYNIYDVINNTYASDILTSVRDAISAATRANVSIYSIDPRGLADVGDEGLQMQTPPDDQSLGLGLQSMRSELRLSQDSLRTVSDETGGFTVLNTNDFKTGFDRIVRENSSYYVLGYYPANERRDGRFRKIEVRVTRPGVEVRARKGYVAPSGKAPVLRALNSDAVKTPELREALESPVPVAGLMLSASAAAFKGAAPNASVVVTIQVSGQDLKFEQKGGRYDGNLEVSLLAVDRDGKIVAADRQILDMALKPETLRIVEQAGFRMISRLSVPPGHYQLRIAGRESKDGRVGSVYYDLAVPDFSRGPLSMSGIVLTSKRAALVPTPRPDEEIRKALSGPPTTARAFLGDDEVAVLAEIYDNQPASPHKVQIATTVRADAGRTVFQHADERSSAELNGKSGGYGYTTRIPLRDIPAGLYVLRIEARSTLGKGDVVSREVAFRVVGK